ncbi:hypothetical protein BD414DRAFT_497436 [Trametes punicea]|nr:hypothetical protein BD414DRAFT_497436 [Trametes punicea]
MTIPATCPEQSTFSVPASHPDICPSVRPSVCPHVRPYPVSRSPASAFLATESALTLTLASSSRHVMYPDTACLPPVTPHGRARTSSSLPQCTLFVSLTHLQYRVRARAAYA